MEGCSTPVVALFALFAFISLDCGQPRAVEVTHAQTAEWRMIGIAIPHEEGRATWKWSFGQIDLPIKKVAGPKVSKTEFEAIERKILERLAGFEAHLDGKPVPPEATSDFRAGWHAAAVHGESP